jgi:hypothetical protein
MRKNKKKYSCSQPSMVSGTVSGSTCKQIFSLALPFSFSRLGEKMILKENKKTYVLARMSTSSTPLKSCEPGASSQEHMFSTGPRLEVSIRRSMTENACATCSTSRSVYCMARTKFSVRKDQNVRYLYTIRRTQGRPTHPCPTLLFPFAKYQENTKLCKYIYV